MEKTPVGGGSHWGCIFEGHVCLCLLPVCLAPSQTYHDRSLCLAVPPTVMFCPCRPMMIGSEAMDDDIETACIPLLSPPLQQVVYPCEESKLNVAATFETSRWLEKKNITGEKVPNLGLASLSWRIPRVQSYGRGTRAELAGESGCASECVHQRCRGVRKATLGSLRLVRQALWETESRGLAFVVSEAWRDSWGSRLRPFRGMHELAQNQVISPVL